MVTLSARACPVCGGMAKSTLFRQEFGSLSEGSLLAGYDLTVCGACGGAYADEIPAQDHFDRYYGEMSKYEYSDNAGVQSESYLQNFREMADLVAPHLKPSHRLLDVGCATGGLLAEFKRRGFSNLLGVDPSPSCARVTQQLYGIESRCLNISELGELGEQFDVIFLTGVLEHLRDVDPSLNLVKARLRPGGLIFFVVPDASRYEGHPGAPFQFFSMEHVNFFAPKSLRHLMARHGFSCVLSERLPLRLSPKAIEPSIGALFRLERSGADPVELEWDDETGPALRRYIQQSRNTEQRILSRISSLADAGLPLAVWGTGTHTLRLMETSRLPSARIIAFLDSNPNYQGKTLAGIPVVAPAAFSDASAEILISSQAAEDEIFQLITQKLHWPNKVHRLYASQPLTT